MKINSKKKLFDGELIWVLWGTHPENSSHLFSWKISSKLVKRILENKAEFALVECLGSTALVKIHELEPVYYKRKDLNKPHKKVLGLVNKSAIADWHGGEGFDDDNEEVFDDKDYE